MIRWFWRYHEKSKKVVFLGINTEQTPKVSYFTSHNALYQLYYLVTENPRLEKLYDFTLEIFDEVICSNSSNTDTSLVLSRIIQLEPDIVLFSVYSWNVLALKYLASYIKQIRPETIIIAGGPEFYDRQDAVKLYQEFGILVEGHGDITIEELLLELGSKEPDLRRITNISFKTPDGTFKHNPNNTKKPARFLAMLHVFSMHYSKILVILKAFPFLSTRGYKFSCTYCLWTKQPFRYTEPEAMLKNLEQATGFPSIKIIHFFDLMEIKLNNPVLYSKIETVIKKLKNQYLFY